MAIELANAYISVSVETKNIPRQINAALAQSAKGAEAQGRNTGTAFTNGLGKGAAGKGNLAKSVENDLAATAGVAGAQGERTGSAYKSGLSKSTAGAGREAGTAAASGLSAAAASAGKAGENTGRSFTGSLQRSLKNTGAFAAVAVGIGAIAGAIKGTLSTGMQFTTNLNTLQAVSGATAQQMRDAGAAARQLGNDTSLPATSANDAAAAMTELAKGGFSVQQAMAGARGTLQLAAAAQIDAAQAATIESQALQAYGENASYAGKAADILANGANQSSAEITDVALALAQGGAVAHQFGMNMRDSVATISLLANAGIKGADAGTLMKSSLLALNNLTPKQTSAAQQLGLQLEGNNIKFNGMQDLFTKLGVASKNMTKDQYNQATALIFGSDAARIAGVAATVGGAGFADMAKKIDQNGTAAQVAAAKMHGLPGAMEQLKNAAQDVGLTIYTALQGPLAGAARGITSAINGVNTAIQGIGHNQAIKSLASGTVAAFKQLGSALASLAPAAGKVMGVLGEIAKFTIGTGWTVFNGAIRFAADTLTILKPLIDGVASALSALKAPIAAIATAFLAWKAVSSVTGSIKAGFTAVRTGAQEAATATEAAATGATAVAAGTRAASAGAKDAAESTTKLSGSLQNLGGAAGRVVNGVSTMRGNFSTFREELRNTDPEMSTLQRNMSALSKSSPDSVFGKMAASFTTASTGAARFSTASGAAAAAGTGLKSAASGVAGVFGGPLGIALAGGAVLVGAVSSKFAEVKQTADAYKASVQGVVEAEQNLRVELEKSHGALTDQVLGAQTDVVSKYKDELNASMNNKGGNLFDSAKATGATAALKQLGLTNEEVARSITTSQGSYDTLRNKLISMGGAGVAAVQDLDRMRANFVQQQQAAEAETPGIMALGDAIQKLGDKNASASEKSNALNTALDQLDPARGAGDALETYNKVLQQVTQDSQQAADRTQGFGKQLLASNGDIDTQTANGVKLRDSLNDIVHATQGVAASGGDMNATNARNEQQFAALAQKYGVSIADIKRAADTLGLSHIDLAVSLANAPETIRQIGLIKANFDKVPGTKTITLESSAVNDQTRAKLQQLGFEVKNVPGTKNVTVTALDNASIPLANIAVDMNRIPRGKAIDVTAPGGQDVLNELTLMGVHVQTDNNKNIVVTSPMADTIKNKLAAIGIEVVNRNGKNVIVTANDADYQAKKGDWTQTVIKRVVVQEMLDSVWQDGPPPTPHADGAIVKYADGGTTLPDKAIIQKPVGRAGLVQWAEPETEGEAFIPLANSKRDRSTNILAAVANMFGLALLPKDQVPDTISGQIGAIGGNAVTKLLAAAGPKDGVLKFAEGGIVTGDQLLQLAKGGYGASRPLDGAPYVWGGVNFGDCSGAMAAFARFAAGLPPFGGRFSTANEGDYLTHLGAKMGQGGPGTLRFGWYNGGEGGGHTAGTLPDGTNIEMGGARGNGQLGGGAAGANNPEFTNHAYMEVKNSDKYTSGGSDTDSVAQGSQLPDDSSGSGYSFDPVLNDDSSDSGSGDTSLSGRAGSVVGSFITGELSDFFQTLSVNDQPAWLKAITDYEKQRNAKAKKNYDAKKKQLDQDFKDAEDQRETDFKEAKDQIEQDYQSQLISADERDRRLDKLRDDHDRQEINARHDYENNVVQQGETYGQVDKGALGSLSLKQKYENEQVDRAQANESARFNREAQYNRDKQQLDQLRDSHTISQDEYQRRLGALKAKYDSDIAAMKAQYQSEQAQAKAAFSAQNEAFDPSEQYTPTMYAPGQFHPTDPKTSATGAAGDAPAAAPGKVKSSKAATPQDAVKNVFADKHWNQGAEWKATDYIVSHESHWNPLAVNPSSGAFGLFQFLGSTLQQYLPDKNPDPGVQGNAGEKYISDRYGDPIHAQQFWASHGWYDDGGIAGGIGYMAKNTLKPERVLSPKQTESFDKLVDSNFGESKDNAVIQRLDRLISEMGGGKVTYNIQAGNTERAFEEAQRKERQRAAANLGRF